MYMVPYYIRLNDKNHDYILKQTDWMGLYFLSDVSFITIKSKFSLDSPHPSSETVASLGPATLSRRARKLTVGDACRGTSAKDQV